LYGYAYECNVIEDVVSCIYLYTELFRYLRTIVNGLEERNDPTDSDGRNIFYCVFVFVFQLIRVLNLLPAEICLQYDIHGEVLDPVAFNSRT